VKNIKIVEKLKNNGSSYLVSCIFFWKVAVASIFRSIFVGTPLKVPTKSRTSFYNSLKVNTVMLIYLCNAECGSKRSVTVLMVSIYTHPLETDLFPLDTNPCFKCMVRQCRDE